MFLHKWVLASLRHMEYVEVYFSFHFTVDEDHNNITCIGQAKNKGFLFTNQRHQTRTE